MKVYPNDHNIPKPTNLHFRTDYQRFIEVVQEWMREFSPKSSKEKMEYKDRGCYGTKRVFYGVLQKILREFSQSAWELE